MFGFLGDNIDSVKQAAEANNMGKQESQGGSGPAAGAGDGSLAAGLPGFGGFWSVAKAVQSAVQQTADEVVRSVQTTDWKSELAAFTHEVEAEAQKVSHKAVEVVQHLPAQLHTRSSESGAGGDGSEGGEGGSPSGSSSSGGGGSGQPFGAVGSSLANFGKQLISGTKEVIDTVTDLVEGEIATAVREVPRFAAGSRSSSVSGGRPDAAARLASRQRLATKYSRFEAEVAAMQRDSATYVDEPEDAEDFAAWKASSSFSMDTAQPEVDKILAGNAFLSELQGRLVPLLVEKEDFWARYFYRLHKLQQKEEQRQQLAARAKQLDDAEDLGGWDDDESPHAAAAAAETEAAAPAAAAAAVRQQEQEQPDQEQQQQPPAEPAAVEPADVDGAEAAAASIDDEKAQAGSVSEGSAAEVQEPQELQQAPDSAAAVPESGGKAPAAAAAAAAAVTAATTAVARKLSDESSFPSTPVQVGSDASDAAVATDTVSEASGATAAGGQAPWTLVTGSPSAPTPAAAAAAASGAAATPAGEAVSKAGLASTPAKQQGSGQQHTAPEPAAAVTAASSSPAAAAAKPAAAAAAAAAAEDGDDDWGDDADDAVAAVAARKAGAAGAAAGAAAGEGDDDWGNWE